MSLSLYFEAAKRRYHEAKLVYAVIVGGVAAIGGVAAFVPKLAESPYGAVVLVLAPLTITVGAAVTIVISRNEILRQRLARELVDRLHKRWFSTEHNGLDKEHRVTLYVPSPSATQPKIWKCIARSGGGECKLGCDWNHPERDDEHAGPVAFVARNGSGIDIPGVPNYEKANPTAKEQYRLAVKMDELCVGKRTWPGASLSARTFRAKNGTVPAVIIVERISGEPIRPTALSDCRKDHDEQFGLQECDEATQRAVEELSKVRNPIKVELALAAVVAAALWER